MGLDLAVIRQLAPSAAFVLAGVAALGIYYAASYRQEFIEHGEQAFAAIRSADFSNYILISFGGSVALWFNTLADCWGKYLLRDEVDSKYLSEFTLILTILLPSICLLSNWEDINAISFYWVLFHVQILVILNVAILFWAEKMKLSNRSPEVLVASSLSVATFVLHVFAIQPSWTATSVDGGNVAYMCLFAAQLLHLLHCMRQTRNKNNRNKHNAVVLIDTAAVEQQWAMCVISAIFSYYLAFLVLEAGVYPGNDRMHLQSDYLCAQYGLLSVFALVILTLHQRKEMYHGIMSQASLEIKRLFVRYVSHEIRTPLNTTLLGLNLLETDIKDGVEDRAVLAELVTDATSSCTIAIDILNDLLMYEKIDGGLLTLERAETPVWAFVEGVLKVFLIQAKSSNVELSWPRRCIKGVHAEIDHYKLSQVLRNLVSNALKFTPAGGRVRVSAEVLAPGSKPRTARSLCVLREMDESAAEEYEASGGGGDGISLYVGTTLAKTGELVEGLRRASAGAGRSRKSKNKPAAAKSIEFDDFSAANTGGINQSASAASEETPPHIYAYPGSGGAGVAAGSPKPCAYSARGVLFPDASTTTMTTSTMTGAFVSGAPTAAAAAAGGRGGASTAPSLDFGSLSAAPSMDLFDLGAVPAAASTESVPVGSGTSSAPVHNPPQQGAATTSAENIHTPAPKPLSVSHPADVLRDSPESSNESSPPEKTAKKLLSDSSRSFLRKMMFSADQQDRTNMQIFPTVSVVRISVTDSGAGISKENQERLFKEIVQFNAGKLQNGQGSGIGLWISNTIVKLHGGTIGVLSDGEGTGSTFYIDIPISKIERGSNYNHVSPAHLDVSSKNMYNSPACSPDQRSGRKGQHSRSGSSQHSSPLVKNSPHPQHHAAGGFNPNRTFISPESERSSYRATLAVSAAGQQGSDRQEPSPLLHAGPPLVQLPFEGAAGGGGIGGGAGGVSTSLRAPLYPYQLPPGAGATAGDGFGPSSARYMLDGLPKQYSDQSIFTGSGASHRSNRSRGTNQSSFSTDADDGVSSKTEGINDTSGGNSSSRAAFGLSVHMEVAVESVQEEDHRPTTFAPYTAGNPAVNLFPEDTTLSKQQQQEGSAPHSKRSDGERVEEQQPAQQLQPQETATAPVALSVISAEALRAKRLFEKSALIVDDSVTNRKFVNRLLRTKIGTRDEAEDGQQAVHMVAAALAAGTPYDVILMDYVMPVMDGPTATEQIRKGGFRGIILGVTGNGHQAEIDLFKNAGADRILVKPLSAEQFYGTLLDVLT